MYQPPYIKIWDKIQNFEKFIKTILWVIRKLLKSYQNDTILHLTRQAYNWFVNLWNNPS